MTNTLLPGQTLTSGESLTSTNGLYMLTMGGTGNLVLTVVATNQVLWSSATRGKLVVCTMEYTGDLAVHNANVLFDTGTFNDAGAYLVLEDTGNLILFSLTGNVLWSTNTAHVVSTLLHLSSAKAAMASVQQMLASAEASFHASLKVPAAAVADKRAPVKAADINGHPLPPSTPGE
jgi:hypothetical protein